MSLLTIALLFLAGLFAGAINAVAGGGTFISFGAFSLIGMPPVVANASSSIAQLPGYVTSTLPYLKDIRTLWRGLILLAIASMAGAVIGSSILLWLDNDRFRVMVPWLLLAATALFAAGPWLKPRRAHEKTAEKGRNYSGPIVQFLGSIYGGFFGAGMGIMMLATLGLTESGDYHRLNAIKNVLSNVIAVVAIAVFATGGVIDWAGALAMAPGIALGGFSGVWIAKRVPQIAVRLFVIAFGVFLAGYYFVTG
ncbi:sulfite exporter TauE/SafE family protein [Fulvimarina sp. MAC8]|uniref:sulfite exporter TauE/SafE family protein n=1 Tax=Fulvimarina sp. MAC8 TaxID=3162874 RepID=UPI0032EF341D